MLNMKIIQVSPEDLEQLISKAVGEQLRKSNLNLNNQDELLTREETAKYFKSCLATIRNWTKEGRIVKYMIGDRVYYKKSELEKALTKNEVR